MSTQYDPTSTALCSCGASAARLPVLWRDGSASFYCARCCEVITIAPAMAKVAA